MFGFGVGYFLLLGVAYKNDVADMRESPALDILSVLEKEGAQVAYHDSFVPEFRHGEKSYKQVDLTVEELRKADCVVVTCKHKGIDWGFVAQHAKLIVDSRNAYPRNGKSPGPARIVKL